MLFSSELDFESDSVSDSDDDDEEEEEEEAGVGDRLRDLYSIVCEDNFASNGSTTYLSRDFSFGGFFRRISKHRWLQYTRAPYRASYNIVV